MTLGFFFIFIDYPPIYCVSAMISGIVTTANKVLSDTRFTDKSVSRS